MKFKNFLKLYEAENKDTEKDDMEDEQDAKPKKKIVPKVKKGEEEEKTEEEKIQEQIILLRIDLKDATTDEQAQSIQNKINVLLSKQKENKTPVKDTKDEINKDSKTSKPSKEKEPQ